MSHTVFHQDFHKTDSRLHLFKNLKKNKKIYEREDTELEQLITCWPINNMMVEIAKTTLN